jgi:hypothetical protein
MGKGPEGPRSFINTASGYIITDRSLRDGGIMDKDTIFVKRPWEKS